MLSTIYFENNILNKLNWNKKKQVIKFTAKGKSQ